MVAQKRYLLLVVALVCVGMTAYAKKKSRRSPCEMEDTCLMDPNCKCYCSEKGDFRKKTKNDSPLYVKDDPRGKYCYCKQWDWDNFPKADRPAGQEK